MKRSWISPSEADKHLSESLPSSGVRRHVLFPCCHRPRRCRLILTLPAQPWVLDTMLLEQWQRFCSSQCTDALTIPDMNQVPSVWLPAIVATDLAAQGFFLPLHCMIATEPNWISQTSPPGDVRAAHSASRSVYLSLQWQQRQALKCLFIMPMIIYLKVRDEGKNLRKNQV